MKHLCIFFLALCAPVLMAASTDFVVTSFDVVPKDLTAATSPRTNLNGEVCGVIKVQVADELTEALGNVIGSVVNHGMEKWVYVSPGTKMIELHFRNHMPLRINFADYDYPSITGKMTYVMRLDEKGASATSASTLPGHATPKNCELQAVKNGQVRYFNVSEWRGVTDKDSYTVRGLYLSGEGTDPFLLSLYDNGEFVTWDKAMEMDVEWQLLGLEERLPNKAQGVVIALNATMVKTAIKLFGGDQEADHPLWTNEEYDSSTAWSVSIYFGTMYKYDKTYDGSRVRPVAPVAAECTSVGVM